jgi:hypothetical protein
VQGEDKEKGLGGGTHSESMQGGGDLLQLSYLANRHLCEIAGYSDGFQMGMRHGRCLTKASFFLVVGMGMERMPG